MRKKLYFNAPDGEGCYPLEYHRAEMSENGDGERILYEAVRETNSEYFFCKEFGEVGLVGEGCGKFCESYSPRNGKNGRCRHSSHCYEPSEKTITIYSK